MSKRFLPGSGKEAWRKKSKGETTSTLRLRRNKKPNTMSFCKNLRRLTMTA